MGKNLWRDVSPQENEEVYLAVALPELLNFQTKFIPTPQKPQYALEADEDDVDEKNNKPKYFLIPSFIFT